MGHMLCVCISKRCLGVVMLGEKTALPPRWVQAGISFRTENVSIFHFSLSRAPTMKPCSEVARGSTAVEAKGFLCLTVTSSLYVPTSRPGTWISVTESWVLPSGSSWSRG